MSTKPVRPLQPMKKPPTMITSFSGSRLSTPTRLTQSQQFIRSRLEKERTLPHPVDQRNRTEVFHPWDPTYHKIVRRPKCLKPMTKDPYTIHKRLMTTAVLGVNTELECCPPLIPAAAVKTEGVTIQRAPPRRPVPTVVRYLRRNQLLPSEQVLSSIPKPPPAPVFAAQSRRPSATSVNMKKTVAFSPILTGTERLLYRDQLNRDSSTVRRPMRKLGVNATHETILPLTVYG